MERCDFPIDPNNSRVFLLYSRYWHFCKYSEKYKTQRVVEQKKYFFERLIEIYTLNEWKFCYLEWVFKKMDVVNLMVDPTLFIVKNNAPLDYLVPLTECYKLFSGSKQRSFVF